MDIVDVLILGVVQGVTEFLPISSTGHLILAREFFGITSAHGLAVDAILQLATALAVVIYFWKDLCRIALDFSRGERKVGSALILGTIPAVIVGLLLEEKMETAFRSADLVAVMLIAGSVLFIAAEYVAKRYATHSVTREVTPQRGLLIGLFQCLALIPGMSRSGATISGGLFLGLSREEAARFGFLLAIPIILGSGLKKVLDLGSEGLIGSLGPSLAIGSLVAFGVGLLAIHYLLKFLRNHTLLVFAAYRIVLAGVVFVFL